MFQNLIFNSISSHHSTHPRSFDSINLQTSISCSKTVARAIIQLGKSNQKTRANTVIALVAVAALSGCASQDPLPTTVATKPDIEPRALGLNPPTAEELARMDALAEKNPVTFPNALARERLNAERKAQGLPPLSDELVAPSVPSSPK